MAAQHPDGSFYAYEVCDACEEFTYEIDGVAAEWTVPADVPTDSEAAVMYIHGGGYVAGAPDVCRLATSRIALGLGVRVISPDYRLAPEHPFPAAHEDVLAVYRELITAQGVRPEFQITPRNAGAIAAICAKLEGIPLAIELAAAYARAMTPAQMLERIAARFELLVSRRADKGADDR